MGFLGINWNVQPPETRIATLDELGSIIHHDPSLTEERRDVLGSQLADVRREFHGDATPLSSIMPRDLGEYRSANQIAVNNEPLEYELETAPVLPPNSRFRSLEDPTLALGA